jgi:hypothetical protein
VSVGVALQGRPPDGPEQAGAIGFRTGALSTGADVRLNAAPTPPATSTSAAPDQELTGGSRRPRIVR